MGRKSKNYISDGILGRQCVAISFFLFVFNFKLLATGSFCREVVAIFVRFIPHKAGDIVFGSPLVAMFLNLNSKVAMGL